MWYRYSYFPRSRPRQAKGGIKAQSKRGGFGQSWWAQRWIAVLESFDIGARLSRGRSYARNGQVLSIDMAKGVIKAKVQGSRPKPYDVTIQVRPLSSSDWKKLASAIARQAIFTAKLLAGEMPQDIEAVFKQEGLSLFPTKLNDLQTECSCPDWSNPCKHVAAVYYLLGEEFDRDPFLIFKMRGLTRDELLRRLSGSSEATARAKPKRGDRVAQTEREESPAEPAVLEPLTTNLQEFWAGCDLPDDFFGAVELPPVAAALPKRLGSFPFWRGAEHFLDSLETIYPAASEHGVDAFLGERQGEKSDFE